MLGSGAPPAAMLDARAPPRVKRGSPFNGASPEHHQRENHVIDDGYQPQGQ